MFLAIFQMNIVQNVITLKIGNEISIDKIKEMLVSLGYERYDLIEGDL